MHFCRVHVESLHKIVYEFIPFFCRGKCLINRYSISIVVTHEKYFFSILLYLFSLLFNETNKSRLYVSDVISYIQCVFFKLDVCRGGR